MIAQQTLRTARPLLRSAVRPAAASTALGRAAARRSYASGSASEVRTGGDTPWAIASVLGFGGLFLYLTAPGSKTDSRSHPHGQGDHIDANDAEGEQQEDEADAEPQQPKELPDGSIEHPEGFVEIKRPEMRDDAPAGDKHLGSRSIPDEHAFEKESKVKREAPLPHDDTTFKHGVAAAKDGNPVSDPKKVVAAAKTAKQEKFAAKAESS
ncbi:uncharacterized protein PFL1_06534 [Pseudozyma flocculosa PF-1]|uniref:Uncharacterized protein n=2 Tax=Pseudozyma flocculosa TaxID=84751 RepID=A0A5C3F863_9BASI|nr:uncharacterized protein PFL1_06534 [Pseudozyma flocculosa PF-1]EPQ25859.1 hypothetical protein PFL1_06534 [Pseudozyma flocculosa PF-1]SPO40643.1 uncharacterized protein PSFLO_06125 [Pseudozyma flocculosa]